MCACAIWGEPLGFEQSSCTGDGSSSTAIAAIESGNTVPDPTVKFWTNF